MSSLSQDYQLTIKAGPLDLWKILCKSLYDFRTRRLEGRTCTPKNGVPSPSLKNVPFSVSSTVAFFQILGYPPLSQEGDIGSQTLNVRPWNRKCSSENLDPLSASSHGLLYVSLGYTQSKWDYLPVLLSFCSSSQAKGQYHIHIPLPYHSIPMR